MQSISRPKESRHHPTSFDQGLIQKTPRGEGLDIWAVIEKVKEEESNKAITEQTEESEVMKRLNHYKEEHEVTDEAKKTKGVKSKLKRKKRDTFESFVEPEKRWNTLSGTPKS